MAQASWEMSKRRLAPARRYVGEQTILERKVRKGLRVAVDQRQGIIDLYDNAIIDESTEQKGNKGRFELICSGHDISYTNRYLDLRPNRINRGKCRPFSCPTLSRPELQLSM